MNTKFSFDKKIRYSNSRKTNKVITIPAFISKLITDCDYCKIDVDLKTEPFSFTVTPYNSNDVDIVTNDVNTIDVINDTDNITSDVVDDIGNVSDNTDNIITSTDITDVNNDTDTVINDTDTINITPNKQTMNNGNYTISVNKDRDKFYLRFKYNKTYISKLTLEDNSLSNTNKEHEKLIKLDDKELTNYILNSKPSKQCINKLHEFDLI